MSKLKLYKISIYTLIAIGFGCNDWLETDSEDLLIPKTVDEYYPMLYAEGYPSSFNSDVSWFKLMTDDVEMGRLEIDPDHESAKIRDRNSFDRSEGGEGLHAYKWEEDIEKGITDFFWPKRYSNILGCNVIIDALPRMKIEGDSTKYAYLAAQAYAMRAYHYWCLINTYALPYSTANRDKPGVIIRTRPQVDIKPKKRSSIGEVYDLINEDIRKAIVYIEKSHVPGNKHLLTRPAILFLASRIALFQEKWEEVINISELFLKSHSYVFDLNNVDTTLFGASKNSESFYIMNGKVNKEIIFTFGNNSTKYNYLSDYLSGHFYALGFRTSHSSENSLLKSYEKGDLRRQAWFIKDIPPRKALHPWEEDKPMEYYYAYPSKYRRSYDADAQMPNEKTFRENWRSVEVMLNLAEAYVQKTKTVSQDALDLLNMLRRGRIAKTEYADKTTADFATAAELLDFIRAERRRELCFEEAMRFWDMRRQGMPEVKHIWYSAWNTTETYVLKAGSPNYVLRIPNTESHYNDGLKNNVREIITAR